MLQNYNNSQIFTNIGYKKASYKDANNQIMAKVYNFDTNRLLPKSNRLQLILIPPIYKR